MIKKFFSRGYIFLVLAFIYIPIFILILFSFHENGTVSLENLKEFLDCDKIFAVGGSWMMKGDITKNCLEIEKVIKGE